jgi:putative salt-induced outer membrane protein
VLGNRCVATVLGFMVTLFATAPKANAQGAPPPLTGAPPPEAKALVEAPPAIDAPTIDPKVDGTSVSVSAGGVSTTGNSRLLALTANGIFEKRFNRNGVGLSLLANYGRSAAPGESIKTTTENLQGRMRYDRYVMDEASFFLITTGRHDRFQGLDLRLNIDPGFKYLFLKEQVNALWAEGGYDFQYDLRRNDARQVLDPSGAPVVDAAGNPILLARTATDHSTRLFAGFRHGFNEQVTLAAGLEYLQSVVDSARNRINFDALFAAKVGGGLALGVGFGARYDHAPLPGKEKLDTTANLSLIYAFSETVEAPKEPAPQGPDLPPAVSNPPPLPEQNTPNGPSAPSSPSGAPPVESPPPATP